MRRRRRLLSPRLSAPLVPVAGALTHRNRRTCTCLRKTPARSGGRQQEDGVRRPATATGSATRASCRPLHVAACPRNAYRHLLPVGLPCAVGRCDAHGIGAHHSRHALEQARGVGDAAAVPCARGGVDGDLRGWRAACKRAEVLQLHHQCIAFRHARCLPCVPADLVVEWRGLVVRQAANLVPRSILQRQRPERSRRVTLLHSLQCAGGQ